MKLDGSLRIPLENMVLAKKTQEFMGDYEKLLWKKEHLLGTCRFKKFML